MLFFYKFKLLKCWLYTDLQDPSCDFLEPETAIQVFRKGGMNKQAYQLAKKHHLYGNALQILLEDVRDPAKDDLFEILENGTFLTTTCSAIRYIHWLISWCPVVQDEKAEAILRRYGCTLVQLVSQTDPKATGIFNT